MDRREFLLTSGAALFSTLLASSLKAFGDELAPELAKWRPGSPLGKNGPAPMAEITAAVDTIVPADPEIPGDFKGSDYGADWIVAATLTDLGQIAVVVFLDRYAKKVAGLKFIDCTPDQRLEAIKQWIREREEMDPMLNDMLTGLLTMSMIGTYEENDPDAEARLFESMGWYDPLDPAGTFRIPCEGYPDARQFPVRLKKGFRK